MIWVTLKNGEVRRYNNGGTFCFDKGWLKLGTQEPIHKNSIGRILESEVSKVEFEEPCHITRAPNLSQTQLQTALRIVLTEAKNVTTWSTEARLLSDVKNLLAGFNLKTKRFRRVA